MTEYFKFAYQIHICFYFGKNKTDVYDFLKECDKSLCQKNRYSTNIIMSEVFGIKCNCIEEENNKF